jgi:hypothetical protein
MASGLAIGWPVERAQVDFPDRGKPTVKITVLILDSPDPAVAEQPQDVLGENGASSLRPSLAS